MGNYTDTMKTRMRKRWWFIIVPLIILVAVIAFEAFHLHDMQVFESEISHYNELGGLAKQMIQEHGPGVSGEGWYAYISSYDEFFRFVAKKRPEIVSTADAANPFPGLLTSKQYGRLQKPANSRDEILIWDVKAHHGGSDVQLRLDCSGRLVAVVKER